MMDRAGLTDTVLIVMDQRRICSCSRHIFETVIKHASVTCKGSTFSHVYS